MRQNPLVAALLLALVLSGCGAPKALPVAARAPEATAAARGVGLKTLIANALADAKTGPDGARRAAIVLHALAAGFKFEQSRDLADRVAIGNAQRALVRLVAAQPGNWLPAANGQLAEVRYGLDMITRQLELWARTPDSDVDFEDVLATVEEALDAALDRFPALPPEAPPAFKTPLESFVYAGQAHKLLVAASALARSGSDRQDLAAAFARTMDRAIKTADMPKDMIATLAVWEGEVRRLAPNPPPDAP